MALATFDCKKLVFHVSYQLPALSEYRQGRTILLHPDSPQTRSFIDETISYSEARKRLRRIPNDLLDLDPRELFAKELFLNETEPGHPNLKRGDEVEVQWRMTQTDGFGWWRVCRIN
jgi:hypothetical protein